MLLENKQITFKNFNDNITIKYYLIQNKFNDLTTYGIKLEKINNNVVEDIEEVLSFTDDFNFAKNVFEKIVSNTVTPVTLINILDDLISEYCY